MRHCNIVAKNNRRAACQVSKNCAWNAHMTGTASLSPRDKPRGHAVVNDRWGTLKQGMKVKLYNIEFYTDRGGSDITTLLWKFNFKVFWLRNSDLEVA